MNWSDMMTHMFLRARTIIVSLVVWSIAVLPAHAAPYGFPDPLNDADVPTLINRIITQVLGIIGALFFLMFLWGGFQYLTAGGDTKKVGSAQKTLVNAVIGILIIAVAYGIVQSLITVFATVQTPA